MPKGYDSITLKPETTAKLRAIAAEERRSLIETMDIIADEKLKALGIEVPSETPKPAKPSRRHSAAA